MKCNFGATPGKLPCPDSDGASKAAATEHVMSLLLFVELSSDAAQGKFKAEPVIWDAATSMSANSRPSSVGVIESVVPDRERWRLRSAQR